MAPPLFGREDPTALAKEHYQRATEFHAKGETPAAVIELKNALQQDPNFGPARLLLGQTYVELGDGAAAAKELERAAQLGIRGPELEAALAKASLLQGRVQEALDRVVAADPDKSNPELLVLMGDLELSLGQPDKAKESYSHALELDPNSLTARRGLAKIGLSSGDSDEALRQINLALGISAEDLQTWLLKGELEFFRNDPGVAERSFQHALSIDTHSVPARVGLSRALLAEHKPDAASEHVEVLYKANSKDPLVNYLRALIAQQRGDVDTAQSALREVLSIIPGHIPSMLMLGTIHYTRHDFAQAEELVERVLHRVPQYLPARKLLAAIRIESGQPDKAIELLEPLAQANDKDAQLLALLGTAYMAKREFEKGNEFLAKASAITPDAAAIRTQLALTLLALGAQDQALAELQSAANADPGFAKADLLLVLAHLQRGEFEQAIAAAAKLTEKQPDNPVSYNLLGAAYQSKGDLSKARASYEKALVLQPGFTVAALNLARLDVQAGDRVGARRRLQSALMRAPDDAGTLVAMAQLESEDGHVSEGLALIERARERNAGALEPRLILAQHHLRQGDRHRALAMANEAFDIAPENPRVMLMLAQAQMASGDHAGALQILGKLTERFPESADAHYQLALAQDQSGNVEAARASLQRALSHKADYLLAKVALGQLQLRTGDREAATEIAKQLQTTFPKDPAGFGLEGDVHMTQGQPAEALAAYHKGMELSESGALAFKIASALRAAGDAESSMTTLQQWLQRHPTDHAIRLALATLYQASSRPDDAILAYEEVLKGQATNAVALNNLAWLYYQRDDPRALGLAEKAYRQFPNDASIIDTYGWLLMQKENVERGLGLVQLAHGLAPDNGDIRYHVAAGLAKSGQTERAKQELQALLGSPSPFSEREAATKLLDAL